MRIAIDGPVASGKSAVGKLLADRLGYRFLDTGAMYRTITWLAQRRGIPVSDGDRLGEIARSAQIVNERPAIDDGRDYTVLVDSQDVTWEIRSPDVEAEVSQVSSWPAVRAALVDQQRRIAGPGQIVMAGRDIGTVVLPDAELKIFLTASTAERARRRGIQLRARGEDVDDATVLADLAARDAQDSQREHSPLRPAADARLIDSTDLTIDEVIDRIVSLIGTTA